MPAIREIGAGLRSRNEKKRWAAAVDAGDLLYTRPRAVWKLILEHGSSRSEDLRTAVATCMLEHLLEEYFDEYFPLLEQEIRAGNRLLGDTFSRCWKFGMAKSRAKSSRWDQLRQFVDAASMRVPRSTRKKKRTQRQRRIVRD